MVHERSLAPEIGSEDAAPGLFGCPMLVRGHAEFGIGHGPIIRCSLGWAIHNRQEVERCLGIESLLQCWKAEQDRGAVVEAPVVSSRSPKRRRASPVVEGSDAVVSPQPNGLVPGNGKHEPGSPKDADDVANPPIETGRPVSAHLGELVENDRSSIHAAED